MKILTLLLSTVKSAKDSKLIQLKLPVAQENPNADWHNGPHGDIILTEWQEQKLKGLGIDTSTYKVDHTIVHQKGLKAEGTFNKWDELNVDGKIIVPYFLDDTVTESLRQIIHDELADFSYSLGCIELFYDPGLSHDHGVYVFGETSSGDGCWSYVGECPNCGRSDYPEMKDGWQALRLPDWCIDGAGGVHHEFLHAMGLLHEQDRPDFDEHFEANSDGGSMTEEGWFNTGHVLEPSSNLMYSGFTLKNGLSYSSHDLLTTTDAIQVWKQYCEVNYSQFPLPAMATCPSPDVVDAIRPVFEHRFCDGFNNCLGGEDEGSEIVRCEADLTSDGCCASVHMSLFNHDCAENGIVNGKISYACKNGHELRWEDAFGWFYASTVGGWSRYSSSGLFEDNSGVCVHQELSDPNFSWNDGYDQVVECTLNGEMTVLPCANSNCNFEVANCVNNADESGFECECKDEFPNCNGVTTTTEAPTTTTEPSCDVIQNGSGTVTSPGFPNYYGDNESCTYTLNADAGKIIRITFYSFIVEYCDFCECDALTILGNSYCGENFGDGTHGGPPSRMIYIDQESAVLTFTTDYSVTRNGFNFTWESIDDITTTTDAPTTTEAPSCDVIQEGSGTMTSPGFPDVYRNSENCTYTLNADPGKIIRITFDNFTVESSGSCSYDSLTILGQKYCGDIDVSGSDAPPRTMELFFESLEIFWSTDYSVTLAGWSFTWESVTTTTDAPTTTSIATTTTEYTTTSEPSTSSTIATSTSTAEQTTSSATTSTSTVSTTTNEPATTDCNDGNNGGCSHFCNANECACPACWSMKTDGKTCLPQNDLTEITCSASGMRLELHQCVLPGVAKPTLLDSDCEADLVGDTFVFETTLDGCDTVFVVDDDVVTFSNYLLAAGGVTGGIVTSKPVKLEWSCDFALKANVNLTTTNGGLFGDIDMASAPVEVSFGIDEDQPVYGAFRYTLAFYEDNSYTTTKNMDGKIVSVGDTIYAAVNVDVSVAGLEFTIEECVIEDPVAGMSLTMIDAQCGEAIIDTTINSYSDSEMITFSFMGFLFPSGSRNWSSNSQMQLSCSIYVCDDSDSASICSVDPNCGGSSRKRRSAEINRSLATNSVNFSVHQ